MKIQDNGNGETSIRGIAELHGKFTAHTGVTSKTFKTLASAEKYLAKFNISANGQFGKTSSLSR